MKVIVVDPASFSLPYDYNYVKALASYLTVDFYCSEAVNLNVYESQLYQHADNLRKYKISSFATNKIFGLINYLRMLIRIGYEAKRDDIIHFQWSIFFPFELIFFLVFGKQVVFTVHNDIPHSSNAKYIWTLYILTRLTKCNVFVSEFTKKRFEKNYFKSDKNKFLQHGLMYLNDANTTSSSVSTSKYELVFWGRIEPYKGVDIFLEPELFGLSALVVGRWSKQLSELRIALGKRGNIDVVDTYIDEGSILEIIRSRNIFILPYKSATQSGVLYTLLAHRKVFISSGVGENGQFLRKHGLQDLIFDRSDPHEILRAYKFANEYEWDMLINKDQIQSIYCYDGQQNF
jgi:glycosyltransferase involved in cell wall biosynthesis